jgi:hypothetical protein
MIFRCFTCRDYKFWNKECYEVVITSNDGAQSLMTKKICKSCGEAVDAVYQSGKQMSDISASEVE